MNRLTVLYDAGCPICRAARRWLEARAQLVPLEFVPAGSAAARARFPGLDHGATLADITVVADTGEVYVGDGAWLACLWALESHRELSHRLGEPHLLPVARGILETITVPVPQGVTAADVKAAWRAAYEGSLAIDVVEGLPDLTQVVGTDRLLLGACDVEGIDPPVVTVVAALDNLGKGAAGQAVQNMNLMVGWDIDRGIRC